MFAAQQARMLRVVELLRRRISNRRPDWRVSDKTLQPGRDYTADTPRYETK